MPSINFFEDIEDVKEYVAVNQSLEIKSIAPYCKEALECYIFPKIGEKMYNELLEAYNSPEPTPEQLKAIEYLKCAKINFIMYLYLPIGQVNLTDSGVHRAESTKFKSAYKYQIENIECKFLESGWDWLESLLCFIEDNKEKFECWKEDNPYYIQNGSLIINSAKKFRSAYHTFGKRYTYEMIRTIIEDVELIIRDCIGQTLFDIIKLEIQKRELSNRIKFILPKICKAVAHITIEQAVRQRLVSLTKSGVHFIQKTGDDASHQLLQATSEQASAKINQAHEMTNRWLRELSSCMKQRPEDYPEYIEYCEKVDDQICNPPIKKCETGCSCKVCVGAHGPMLEGKEKNSSNSFMF